MESEKYINLIVCSTKGAVLAKPNTFSIIFKCSLLVNYIKLNKSIKMLMGYNLLPFS